MSDSWLTVAPQDLPAQIAGWLAGEDGVLRIAIDGAACLDPFGFAQSLIEPLNALGRPTAHVAASSFWHDASLRFEHAHEDVESYLSWLDADALRREVLDPAVAGGSYLPSLRDPVSNRSTREPARPVEARTVLLVSGELLLGHGLPFDRVIHLTAPPAARARHTSRSRAWTLPALDAYDSSVRPADLADVVIRTDRRYPVVRGLPC